MAKLLMLQGLPASGKTTRARALVDTGNYTRINRDDLRAMMHNSKWSPRNEDMVIEAERILFALAITKGQNVVVDDTNLNTKIEDMWRRAAEEYNATFEIESMDTPFEECVKRDALRNEKRVGRDVIVGMALRSGLFPRPDKGFVLCDLDGTLCDLSHRLQYAKEPTKDWGKFFAGISGDTLRQSTLDILLDAQSRGHKVFFISARPDTYREETIAWLEKHLPADFVYEGLIMRKGNDKREDSIIKQQILDTHFTGKYPIGFVVDDRPRVIRMWRENGLRVIDVGNGEEF